jgi:hypothetical protein
MIRINTRADTELKHFKPVVHKLDEWCKKNCVDGYRFCNLHRGENTDNHNMRTWSNMAYWSATYEFDSMNDALRFKLVWG